MAATASGKGDLVVGSTAGANVSTAIAGAASTIAADATFTINGALGTSTIGLQAAESAKALAARINAQAGTTGVTASARTEIDLATFTASASYSIDVTSDNTTAVNVSFAVGAANNADGLAAAINAFNEKASQTGVTAKLNSAGTGITLTNASGADIKIDNKAASGGPLDVGTATGITAGNSAYVTGAVTLDSDKSFSLIAATAAAGAGFFTGNSGSQLQAVSAMDVSTVDAANRTIAMVDSAIGAVSSQRAKFGALQSRFETTISSLNTSSENMSASRSRVQDADFAVETANLSRAQILQQAGTAMVAQANQLPQGVLALLR